MQKQYPRLRGFTLVEAMLLVLILGIVSLGFGIGLSSSARVPEAVDQRLAIHTRLVEKMEDLISLDFPTVAANNGLSDSVAIGNQNYSRTVTVANVSADGSATPAADFIEVTVAINDQYLKTRMTQP